MTTTHTGFESKVIHSLWNAGMYCELQVTKEERVKRKGLEDAADKDEDALTACIQGDNGLVDREEEGKLVAAEKSTLRRQQLPALPLKTLVHMFGRATHMQVITCDLEAYTHTSKTNKNIQHTGQALLRRGPFCRDGLSSHRRYALCLRLRRCGQGPTLSGE